MIPSIRKRRTVVVSPYFQRPSKKATKTERQMTVKKEEKDLKSSTTSISTAPPVAEEDKKGVPDILDYDLKALFVGINPGLTSAARGHHYAGPTNHFWPCLNASGLTDRTVTFSEDIELARLYRLGFTNLTARTTRKQSDLSLPEQKEGIPILTNKIETLRPRVACFIGKGIYEIFSKQKCKTMGLQDESHSIKWANGDGETVMYVMPSTSGIVSAYQKPDKIRFFQKLNEVVELQDKLYPIIKSG